MSRILKTLSLLALVASQGARACENFAGEYLVDGSKSTIAIAQTNCESIEMSAFNAKGLKTNSELLTTDCQLKGSQDLLVSHCLAGNELITEVIGAGAWVESDHVRHVMKFTDATRTKLETTVYIVTNSGEFRSTAWTYTRK